MSRGVPRDDYYELLGVADGADDEQIRQAWKRLAARWHPDRAGPDATFIFQRLSIAYAVLSDPVARAAYDRKRGTAKPPPPPEPAPPPPPATVERKRAPGVLIRRLSSPLYVLLACGIAREAEDGVIELHVDDEEAAEGGMVTISMRVPVQCPACSPASREACATCNDSRTVEDLFSAWLAIPPEVEDGTVLHPSVLRRDMLGPVVFRVRR